MKTFQVPVWFNVQAEDQEHAWQKIERLMNYNLPAQQHMLTDWVVEEPVEISEED